ncbi:hypothetical protein ACYJ1Y_03570 [Natrialbaceae archaeon A-gly3]
MTIRFTSHITPLPQLFLALMGVIYFIDRVIPTSLWSLQQPTGLKERLFVANINLLQNPTGVAVGAIIYSSLYATTSLIVAVVIPLFLYSGMNFSSPSNLMINGGTILSLFLLSYVIFYWILFLPRLPYSIKQWKQDRFDYDLESEAPVRPAGSILVPVIGWLIVRMASESFTNNLLQVYLEQNSGILIGYSLLYVVIFVYVVVSFPLIHKLVSEWIERSHSGFIHNIYSSMKEIDPKLHRDQWSLLLSGIGVVGLYAVISLLSSILIFATVMLFIIDWVRRQGHEKAFQLGILFLTAIIIFTSAQSATQQGIEAWFLLTTFFSVYLIALAMERYDIPIRFSTDKLGSDL